MSVKIVLDKTPDQLHNRLLQIAEFLCVSKWEIGDIANFLCSMVSEHQLDATKSDVYAAISLMLKSELAPRTVMYYAMLSDFYPFPIRQKYEPLPYAHFYLARTFGDRWQDVLDKAIEFLEERGFPPTEAYLSVQFQPAYPSYPENTFTPQPKLPDKIFESNIEIPIKMPSENRLPETFLDFERAYFEIEALYNPPETVRQAYKILVDYLQSILLPLTKK